MNEEEKKIIEIVENFIKYYKKNEQTGNRANLDVLREECNAIEFILNKYDIQQKELEKNTERINELINEVTLKQCELEKKDKIIDLMANNIADSSNVYENLVNTEFEHTKEEVIEYFTKKASEDNE